MAVAKKRTKMKRTQISLTTEDYDVARQIADRRQKSVSQVFREAIRREAQAERLRMDPLRELIGIVTDDIPHASESIDEVVYGDNIR